MKTWVGGVAVAVLVGSAGVRAEELETILREKAKLQRQASQVVKTMKDAASAKKALPDLDRLNRRLEQAEKRLEPFKAKVRAIAEQQARGARLSEADAEFLDRLRKGKAILDKAEAEGEKERRALNKELLRVEMNPALWKVVRDQPLFRTHRQEQERLARLGAKMLSQQVEIYKLNHRKYPATLAALAEKGPDGSAPLVPRDVLLDPWGQPYHLDASGPRNNGNRADVFSTGHPVERKFIGNWEEPKGAKKP